MNKNEYLIKFEPKDYIKGDSLIAERQGNISICGKVITISNLEFDEKVKININNLVLSKNETSNNLDIEVSNFKGTNDDDTNFNVKFENMSYEFSGCIFKSDVHFNLPKNCTANIDGCVFEEHFYINNGYYFPDKKIDIYQLKIKDSIFKRDFGIYKACIDKIEIYNVDFESLSEFNEVELKGEFNLHEITYKGFTLFDRCTFNTKAQFEYIIFEKFTSFRGSSFNKGLNLDYTSSDKEINFFDLQGLEKKESKEKTSRETYRIIKHNFEKLGNKIDANKYHALELEQKRKELEKEPSKNWQEYLVFKLHDISSEHSTNWLRSLLWIFFVGFFTTFLLHFDIVKDLFFHPYHFKIEYISKICNQFWQFIYIGYMENDLKSKPFIFMLNKILLGYLYYQFLIAVRKDTRK